MPAPLLQIRDLTLSFRGPDGPLPILAGIDLNLPEKTTLGLVGESGCGKTVTALSILRLLPRRLALYQRGQILYRGRDLLTLPEEELRRIRGDRIAMIFQEPMTSLNPVFTVGAQVGEVLQVHRGLKGAALQEKVEELFLAVGIAEPARRRRDYPHQLSGGLRQRVMIAMALACSPELLIADEPSTALDVTIQEQILLLLSELKQRYDMSMLLITHDLGVIAEQADAVAVMYAGRIVESAPARELLRQPRHPYTQGLLRSLPAPGTTKERGRLNNIEGQVPAAGSRFPGCTFADRCPIARPSCRQAEPPLAAVGPDHLARCPWTKE